MKRTLLIFGVALISATVIAQDDPARDDVLEKRVNEFLRTNPSVARQIKVHNIARESLVWMYRVGKVTTAHDDPRARAESAMQTALKIMTDGGKLTQKLATELHEMVFPKGIDWNAIYAAYLKENPSVASAVEGGRITREKVIAGIKSREGEKPPTEEELLDVLYHKLLKEQPNLGRTPKAELMPRLKEMLKRGETGNLSPEKTIHERSMTFGLYFNELIESGQVERFDKDLKRAHDVGATEILRQPITE